MEALEIKDAYDKVSAFTFLHPKRKKSNGWKKAEGRQRYVLYLESWEWAKFRKRIMRQRGFKCEKCKSTKGLQVHHLTYERLGKERRTDVELLCKDCHQAAHGRKF